MSLDVGLCHRVFEATITHNLQDMADAAGLYEPCWRPENLYISRAGELIPLLKAGLIQLKAMDAATIAALTPGNLWGTHADLVRFVEAYLAACKDHPDAYIDVSR